MVDEWPLSQLRPTNAEPPRSVSPPISDNGTNEAVLEVRHAEETSSNNNGEEEIEGEQMDVDDLLEPMGRRLRRKPTNRMIGRHQMRADSTYFS